MFRTKREIYDGILFQKPITIFAKKVSEDTKYAADLSSSENLVLKLGINDISLT